MKTVLVTGGAGFIGSNFIRKMLLQEQGIRIVNLDKLTYAGNLNNLDQLKDNENYTFIKGDICDCALVEEVFKKHYIDTVVNFAAESHVDRSIENPDLFIHTNIMGTQVLLNIAMKQWKKDPFDKYCFDYREDCKFLQVSTDEVYGSLGNSGMFTENTPLAPNSPYSATKAGADLMVRAYYETYGMPINITRCSNNYGPFQFPEKLVPLIINNCLEEKSLPIYGDGMQIRDWLHVEDHCDAILAVLKKGENGEVYNIGGNNERANIEIVKLIIHELKKSEGLIRYVKDRPGHDRRYAIDNTKITTRLGWQPRYTFEHGMRQTIAWYLDHKQWMDAVTLGDYKKYYQIMYESRRT